MERILPVQTMSPERVSQAPLSELPVNSASYEVARHEVMHGLIRPHDVVAISVIPKGDALGWTLLRNVDNVSLAAGIYHGQGYGSDKFRIMLEAINNGYSPEFAVSIAVSEASRILSPQEKVIDLMARELALRGSLTGGEFIDLLGRARQELNDEESFFDWSRENDEEQETEIQESIDLSDNDPYAHIPNEGMYELTIDTVDGYRVEKYKDGKLIGGEIWVLVDDEDEVKKYLKKFSFDTTSSAEKPEKDWWDL